MSSKNERVFIRDLSNLTIQIIWEDWSVSMNVGLNHAIARNSSKYVPSWQLYLHCGNEETSSSGMRFLICHPVLRHSSEHGTSSMGKHLVAKSHIVKLN
jgi:hypothetical protein